MVDGNSEVSAIRTAGMDLASLTWTDQGLFFTDVERDYLLTSEGLTTWPSPKTEVQVATYPQSDGVSYVSRYNLGFGDPAAGQPGYIQQLVVTTPGGSQQHEVVGFTTLTARCDSVLYGVSEVTEPYLELAISKGARERQEPPVWPDMLTQLYPMPASADEALKSVSPDSLGGYGFTATCRDQTILGSTVGKGTPMIAVWPVDGSDRSEHTIVGPDGQDLHLDMDVATAAKVADWSRTADELVWHGGDGVIRATNNHTERTTRLWEAGRSTMTSAYNTMTFVDETAYVLDTEDDSTAQRLTQLRSHNLATGETSEIRTVRPNHELVDANLLPRGIAVRPHTQG